MADTGFTRPNLTQLIERVESDINTRLPGADSRVRRSVLSVLSRILAQLSHGLYGYLDFIARQAIIDTAEAEYVDRWASIWNITRKSATKASGTAVFTGTSGSVINIGTRLRRSDGVEYKTTNAITLSAGTAVASIQAVQPGEAGNAVSNTQLTFVSPISGVSSTALTGEVVVGTDTESDEALRRRLLDRLRQPPHGGAGFDYPTWALEVPGVTRAWVYAQELGLGTVTVRFMMDDTYDDGIPESADVTNVQAYIDGLRPVTADVTVVAPIPTAINFSILLKDRDGATVTDPSIRAAVEAELKDMIRRDAEPGNKILFSRIREAIAIAAGEYDHNITVPSADVSYTTGQIAVFGTITWL